MDLDEYLFYEKKKNKNFTTRQFAQALGLNTNYLHKIVSGFLTPSAQLAYQIEKLTEGKVSGWQLIKRALEMKEQKEKEEQINTTNTGTITNEN